MKCYIFENRDWFLTDERPGGEAVLVADGRDYRSGDMIEGTRAGEIVFIWQSVDAPTMRRERFRTCSEDGRGLARWFLFPDPKMTLPVDISCNNYGVPYVTFPQGIGGPDITMRPAAVRELAAALLLVAGDAEKISGSDRPRRRYIPLHD